MKYKIRLYNNISDKGLRVFTDDYTVGDDIADAEGLALRSYKLSESDIAQNTVAIARAGAGVNNIPVDYCTSKGVVVFNTPGANANAVKELVIAAMLMSSRKLVNSVNDLAQIEDKSAIAKKAEEIKKHYAGPEIAGKTFGIIGLGAIGVLLAEAAVGLGMNVIGSDPYLSVQNAWRMPREVKRADSVEGMLAESDYVSINVPAIESTKHFINADLIKKMKPGVRVLNFARGELANIDDVIDALKNGHIAYYATDFADEKLFAAPNCLCFPHLGASTQESEDNCAVMACQQLKDYLATGTIQNSVNFPDVISDTMPQYRVAVFHKNIPGMIGKISDIIGEAGINIDDMINKSKGDAAYYLIDLNKPAPEALIETLTGTEGVLRVRNIKTGN